MLKYIPMVLSYVPLHFRQILNATHSYGIDRHSFVVAIGGGAVLDMAGFATAVAHRGIRHIRIPTTVLSQNDSGKGVNNDINAYGKKNYLGTLAPPYAMINDASCLPWMIVTGAQQSVRLFKWHS